MTLCTTNVQGQSVCSPNHCLFRKSGCWI